MRNGRTERLHAVWEDFGVPRKLRGCSGGKVAPLWVPISSVSANAVLLYHSVLRNIFRRVCQLNDSKVFTGSVTPEGRSKPPSKIGCPVWVSTSC